MTRRDGTPATERQPARGYSWPPFERGNAVAVRHGASSERVVSERARTVLAELMETHPFLWSSDALVLDVLVRAKVRFDQLDSYIEGVIEGTVKAYPRKGCPDTGIEAVPDRVWQQVSRESRTIVDAASKLGLTPVDRAALFRDSGMAKHFGGDRIAQLAETGRGVLGAKAASGG